MRPDLRVSWLVALPLWLGILGCTPPGLHSTRVPGPSGLLDGQPFHLALGALEGPADPAFQEDLRRNLAKLPGVTVHDHPLLLPPVPPPRSCVFSATIRVDAQEERTTRGTGTDERTVTTTIVTTDVRYRVDDLATGLLLVDGALHEADTEEKESPKAEPGKTLGQKVLEGTLTFIAQTTFDILLNRKSVVEAQRTTVLKNLRRDLGLHDDSWTFWLCSDTGLPGLAEGIEAARAARWQAAADRFRQVVDANPGHPRLHKARYDLGVALLALGRLDEARQQLLQVRSLLQGSAHGLPPGDLPSYVERNESALEHGLLLERRRRWRAGEPL